MNCPACNYMMSDFDAECPRCKGKGIPAPAPAAAPPQVPAETEQERFYREQNAKNDKIKAEGKELQAWLGGGCLFYIAGAVILGAIWLFCLIFGIK